MPWDRGAWEKTTSGAYNTTPNYSPPKYDTSKPKSVSNKKQKYLKNNLVKFMSNGWNISKKKKSQYLNNNYYNAPYRLSDDVEIIEKLHDLISSKSNRNKILVVSNKDLILDEIQLEFSLKDNYRIFKSSKSSNQLENLVNNVEEFEKINNHLFSKYAIKIFPDIESMGQIEDLSILSENLYYIENKEAKLLNEFIKRYWEFYELSNFSNIDLTLAERDVNGEISNLSKKLTSIKNYVKRLNKIVDILDFDIDNLNEFDFEILKNDPKLIDADESDAFLSLLEKYNKMNLSSKLTSSYFDSFSSNSFLLGIITNFERYVDSQNDYDEVNSSILELKNQFKNCGLNVNKLNDYEEIKDNLSNFENAFYIDDEKYLSLNGKLKEFLKINHSFKDYFERCKQNVIFNLESNSIYLKVNEAISNILDVCSNLGISINSLSDFDNHKSDFKILIDYINFNQSNTVANDSTVTEYAKNLFNDLKEISLDLIKKTNEIDESDLDYVIYNIATVKRLISKMGLNIISLNELNKSFSIVSNIENDRSNDIFSNQSDYYIETNSLEIHNDLDTLKSSLNILLEKLKNQPDLLEYPIENLAQSFNNQFKIGFLISNIESYIDSTKTFDDMLENYEVIIQHTNALMDLNNNREFKSDLDKILKQFNSISQMHASQNYSNNQIMIDNISQFKSSVEDDFNSLISRGVFIKENIDNCDVEDNIDKLNSNIDVVRDFIKFNDLYYSGFDAILKNNKITIQQNDEIRRKIENSNMYNFYDVCNQLNKQYKEYDLVKDIFDLSANLNLKEYDNFKDFTLEDISGLSKLLDNCIEFSEYVNKGLIDKNFEFSKDQLSDLDTKIEDIKHNLEDLKLGDSVLENLSQVKVEDIEKIKELLIEFNKHFKIDSANVDELIENYKISLDVLLNLCNDYYIEFEMNNHKFNTSDFKFKLDEIKDDLENYIRLYKIENELSSYSDIIENNLQDTWDGPLTDIEIVKNKLKIDDEFTKLYYDGIFTQNTLNNLSDISESDLLFLNELKTMDDSELKSKYLISIKNRDILIPEINKLDSLNGDDLNSFLTIFVNINKIYKSEDISDCINLLEYNIKHNDLIKLINEAENNLKPYSITYYKYFDSRKFDLSIEEVISKLEMHFKYTNLVDDEIINIRYLDLIKSNWKDFLQKSNKLKDLKDKITKDCRAYFGKTNVPFDEIKGSWEDIDDANIVLMNLDSLRNSFNNNYATYFDYVYVVDDDLLTGEDKLHLFLISRNKISNLKLMEES